MESMDYTSAAALGLGVASVCYISLKSATNARDKNLPPGDLGWPIIGNMLEFLKGSKAFGDRRPAISSFQLLGDRAVFVKDAKMVDTLIRNEGKLIEPNFAYMYGVSQIFGTNGLAGVQGARHKRIRAQLLPAFSSKVVDHVFYTHQKICRSRISRWTQRGTFDGSTDTRDLSADMGCAFVGIDTFIDSDAGRRVMDLLDTCVRGVRGVPINIPGLPTRRRVGLVAREELYENFLRPVIKDRRDNPRAGEDAERDLVTLIMNAKEKDGTPFDDAVIEDNLFTFIFASVDTTATAFMYFVLTMCKYPEIQAKIREEIRRVLGDEYHKGDELSLEMLSSMTYLDQVLQEVMRLHSVISGLFFRKAKVEFELGGYTIPKGMLIRISGPHVATDPKIWTDAEKFDPSRFAPGGEGTKNRKTSMEFGFGTRLCMGKKIAQRERKLFAIFLLSDHRVEFANEKPVLLSPYNPLQKVIGEFPVRFVPVE